MLGLREKFTAVPFFWSQHYYDIPINYVGHAEKWDELAMKATSQARIVFCASSVLDSRLPA